MDFDHLRDKRMTIALMASSGYRLEVLKEEVGKCELVCANCHRDRTYKRKQQARGFDTLYTSMVE